MDIEESRRIHLDWWGKCRTCRWYPGNREERSTHPDPPRCVNEMSPFWFEGVRWSGHCGEWDSFDVDVALEIMEQSDG